MTTLDEAIDQLVALGETDPLQVAKKIIERHDKFWLQAELVSLAEDVISEIARRRLGATRRNAELALRPGDAKSQGEIRLAKAWVPGVGWKPAGKLTRQDLLARADWYERFATNALRRAQWCRDVADLMEQYGVTELGNLAVDLPALPEIAA